MARDLNDLLKAAKAKPMTAADQETQRRSFAYGNAHIENERVTRDMVNKAADAIKPRS
jgi:hypothetical protein